MADDNEKIAESIRALCCCKSDDAARCLELRCGKSTDWDGRAEECSCRCHDELRALYEGDDDLYDDCGTFGVWS